MIKKRRFPVVFPGWWMNIVTGISSGLGHGFYGYGMSVLFIPLKEDLGLSYAATSWAAGIGRLQGGMEAPLTGWLSDKFGPKWVIVVGTLVFGTGLVLMYFVNSVWAYYVIWGGVTAIGLNLALTIAVDKALADWFVKRRGLAFGIRFAIIGICGVIALPVITFLVNDQGWRMTSLIWGLLMFASVPFSWYFVKQKRPEYYGLLPDGVTVESVSQSEVGSIVDKGVEYAAGFDETEFTLRQAMKTPAYWMITLAWVCLMLVVLALNIHFIPLLIDLGIDSTTAGNMMAMMVFFTIPARFLGGILADRVRKDRLHYLVAGSFLCLTLGLLVFLIEQSVTTAYILLVLFGFGSGAPTPLRMTIGGRYFGRKAFASIQGSSMMFAAPVALIAPVYAGWIHDTTGSYISAFVLFTVLAGVAAVLMSLVRPPRPPAQVTDLRRFI